MTFDEFKDGCDAIVRPNFGRFVEPDKVIEVHDKLISFARSNGYPHTVQFVNIGSQLGTIMVCGEAWPSFVIGWHLR